MTFVPTDKGVTLSPINVIYSPLHSAHRPTWEYFNAKRVPHVEVPERLEAIVTKLERSRIVDFTSPQFLASNETEVMDRVRKFHLKQYVNFMEDTSSHIGEFFPEYFIADTYTPLSGGTYRAALTAVDCALTGARALSAQTLVYALCRPPGHHAGRAAMSGYCYFNNAAIAADYLSPSGRVAILDIDYHHGNGTQELLYDRADILYVSIHADPTEQFPYSAGFAGETGRGLGLGYNRNIPLPIGTRPETYMQSLEEALTFISSYDPRYLVVSCGFDAYENDPIGQFCLTIPSYREIGRKIATLKRPTLILQEGGYCVEDLGAIAFSFCQGLLD